MKIGLDVMGGDYAPQTTIEGALLAHKELPDDVRVVLIGQEQLILSELEKRNISSGTFDIVNAPEVIEMKEKPIKAFQNKPNSSLAIGFSLLKSNHIHAFASAGNSGAVMVGAIHSVNTIQGVIRPATVAFVPRENGGYNLLLDVGTNPDCKPDVLYQFGILGSVYAQSVLDISNPRVCLLNIGTEEGKGNLQTQSAFQLMKDSPDFNFIGNKESRDLVKDTADVFVCDGFVGNMVIKQIEAMYRLIAKRQLEDDLFERFNYEIYGGSPILGINAPVVLGHGISSALANKNMILQCKRMYETPYMDAMRNAFIQNS